MEGRDPARLTRSEGRKFGATVGGAFLLLAAFFWWRQHLWPLGVTASLGTLLVLAGLLVPTYLGPVQRGWMRFAVLISKVTNPLVMGLIYYLAITPTGLLRRLFGGSPLTREKVEGSYWVSRASDDARSDMRRQF